ncbi:hypothetical protein [Metabacillus iocasae]|uniref:Yip1 domain-containing protein n=1 Tax=Priestia iocasae TaxID=2291674 RepID=A0ABS2QUV2_9BACI|nr:hypothetical protein [Metabacillus iocasae]MBM7702978.1 hypothetical protein [Metabacillus iocasae]
MSTEFILAQQTKRKLVTASICGIVYAILLGFIYPDPFGERMSSFQDYLFNAISYSTIYMIYSFPAIYLYGTFTSLLSDWLGKQLSVYTNTRFATIYSAIFHLLFGFILWIFSLGAAVLFFIIDRFLQSKKTDYTIKHVLIGLGMAVFVWIVLVAMIWIIDYVRM